MVQNQGIDVYLAPFSDTTKRYQQYAVPAASLCFSNDPNEVYIEAVDGERFVIVVEVMADFHARGGTHLRIEFHIDGDDATVSHQSLSSLQAGAPEGTQLKGRKIYRQRIRKVDGDWNECGFTFSSLRMGTSPSLNHCRSGLTDSK
jgi:hypothetical protein